MGGNCFSRNTAPCFYSGDEYRIQRKHVVVCLEAAPHPPQRKSLEDLPHEFCLASFAQIHPTSITHLSVICVGGGGGDGEIVTKTCQICAKSLRFAQKVSLPGVEPGTSFLKSMCLTARLNQYVITTKIRLFSGGVPFFWHFLSPKSRCQSRFLPVPLWCEVEGEQR